MLSSQDQISSVLNNLFADTDIAYKVIDKHIVLISMRAYKDAMDLKVAQRQKVSGTIVDGTTGEAVPGVNIIIEGTTLGTVSDLDGKFSIEVPAPQSILVFSSVGYLTEKVVVGSQVQLDVKLTPDITKLEEVVVIGYGTRQRKNVVGAVDQIQSTLIEGKPSANLMQAMQGASANLIIQQRSSNPNDNSLNINIRGMSTINNNEPLVVIDGLITEAESLTKINPSDIENVSVLKDAGSAAIYGSRSANGVILVTTKKGAKNNKPVVRLNSMVGIESPNVLYSPVKGYENAILKNQALINGGSAPIYTPEQIRDLKENGDGEWFLDQILQKALQQNYNFSVSGGTSNSTYMVSAGYLNQESNFVGNYGIERYNFRTNLNTEIGRFKVGSIIAYNRTKQDAPNSSASTLIVDGGRIPNYYYYKMKGANGHYLVNDVLSEFNPLGVLEQGGFQKKDEDNIVGTLNGEYEIFKGLKAKGLVGIDLSANHRYIRGIQVPFYSNETATQPNSYANPSRATEDYNEKKYTLNTQLMLDYDRTFGAHNVTGMVGASNESYTRQANEIKTQYTDPILGIPSSGSTNVGSYNTADETQQSSIYSVFGRFGYDYSQKYYAQFSFRYDGSSKFYEDYRWGFFPSFSAGWRISDENFMSFYKDQIGDLKFRGSYGILGNQKIDDYSYFTTYTLNTNSYGFNNSAVSGTGFKLGNKELQWEISKTFNVGFDATFVKGKLFASVDYFNKITSDILDKPEVPTVFGGGDIQDNIGEMKNSGWEFSL
ncbi:MAG TPA: SusC/RagA family TonB-linked outer membrane protein, partial [Bacteroidales bacterium]|nr:SusC/RagA family TonB-linked outer membrane protein [Bacteroidales bacterium]